MSTKDSKEMTKMLKECGCDSNRMYEVPQCFANYFGHIKGKELKKYYDKMRGENTLLVMVYNSKIEMINDHILDCATRCLESLKIILTKEKQMKQSSNKNDLFILLADINFQQEKILSIAKRELECRICKKAFRCEHKVAKLIPEFHIKL